MICQCCKTFEANSKKRPVCKVCYTTLHKLGRLDEYPLLPDLKLKERLINKHGEQVIDDLQNISSMRMQNKYGFTREYARQIFEKVFGYKYTVLLNVRSNKRKEVLKSLRIEKRNPARKVIALKNQNSFIYKGALSEKKVLDICTALNYKVTPYLPDNSIDMVINGYTVDVKSAYADFKTKGMVTKHYRFSLSDKQKNADFIICHIVPLNKFFVIPTYQIKGIGIYIPEKPEMKWVCKNVPHTCHNRYWEYLEAWYLLERKEEIVFNRSLSASAVAI